jgi:hypothetical protein
MKLEEIKDRTKEAADYLVQSLRPGFRTFFETLSFTARNSYHKTEKPTLPNGNPSGWVHFSGRLIGVDLAKI